MLRQETYGERWLHGPCDSLGAMDLILGMVVNLSSQQLTCSLGMGEKRRRTVIMASPREDQRLLFRPPSGLSEGQVRRRRVPGGSAPNRRLASRRGPLQTLANRLAGDGKSKCVPAAPHQNDEKNLRKKTLERSVKVAERFKPRGLRWLVTSLCGGETEAFVQST